MGKLINAPKGRRERHESSQSWSSPAARTAPRQRRRLRQNPALTQRAPRTLLVLQEDPQQVPASTHIPQQLG